jgi:hypothetical protein
MQSRSFALLAIGALAFLAAAEAFAAGTKPAAQVLPRVEYHLRHIEQLAQHFEGVLKSPCPQFATADDWQAWVEAKATGDDEVRRAAKAPRKRLEEARTLLDKLQKCASDNGASFSQMSVWKKIEREVPQRQAQITQPQTAHQPQ